MIILKSREDLDRFYAKHKNKTIGFVPTMGALHEGHLSLIKLAKETCMITIVSIFVNPKQFAPNEDFNQYPRTLEEDLAMCKTLNLSAVFVPDTEIIYPKEIPLRNYLPPKQLGSILCGASRPHFFGGVCEVVARLFDMIKPTHAFFGNKDLQQRMIIEQMVLDLNYKIKIIGGEIIRDQNGVAKSSRNKYLSKESYKKAMMIPNILLTIKKQFQGGESDIALIKSKVKKQLKDNNIQLDYLDFLNSHKRELVNNVITEECFCCIAVVCDGVRLIDNCSMKK